MDQVRHLGCLVHFICHLDGKPLAVSGTCGAGRYFSDQIHSLGCLEKNRKQDTAFGSGMGGRHLVCPHCGILH